MLPVLQSLGSAQSWKLSSYVREDSQGTCAPGQELDTRRTVRGKNLRPLTKYRTRTFSPFPESPYRKPHTHLPHVPNHKSQTQPDPSPTSARGPCGVKATTDGASGASFNFRCSLYHILLGWLKCCPEGWTVSWCLISQWRHRFPEYTPCFISICLIVLNARIGEVVHIHFQI